MLENVSLHYDEREYAYKESIVLIMSDPNCCAEAERALADQRRFVLTPEQWNAFIAALDHPPQPKLRLQRLFAEPSVLDRPNEKRSLP
jgi:hypothetical protein